MPLPRLTSPEAVTRALDEFDQLGADSFRSKYGYGRAKRYFVERDETLYDSKAIFGVALGYEYPDRGFVRNNEFSGGEGSAVRALRRLGFTIRDTRAVQRELTQLVLPQAEVDSFALALLSDEYLEDERNYKVAVHEVVSRLLAVETMARDDFASVLASFFERKLDLEQIGIEGELADQVRSATASVYGVTNAFVNLAGGGFGVNNFIWIPEAVRTGLGSEIRDAFAALVDADVELADRVETFRTRLYEVEEQAQAAGAFKPQWKLIKISLAFTAALLGSFDPTQFTFYHQGKLRKSYEELVGEWPKQNGGELYETVCEFVEAVAGALERQGAPIEDLIDAQSFLYLRASEQEAIEPEKAAALHLVARWSPQHGVDTVPLHKVVAEEHGEVWWGVIGSGERRKLSEENLGRLRAQLDQGVETHVFVAGPAGEEAFRTRLADIAVDRPADENLIPSYYSPTERHSLWLKLADFESLDRITLLQELEPAAEPGGVIALGNQTNPLLVRARLTPRVWWVNQSDSYRRSREGGYLWAPQTNKVGRVERHHEALRYARVGDAVLNYANGQIRAVSAVEGHAYAATRPDPEADQAWGNDGWRLDVAYHDLTTPLPLAAMPEGGRRKAGSPFDKNGEPIQGYMFAVPDAYVSTLRSLSSELAALLPKGDESVPIVAGTYLEPSFEEIKASILAQGLALTDRTIRRYHLSLKSRGFVVLSGVSGTGKTWLAQAYAHAVGAAFRVVPVAPNWTTNEDLLGFKSPLGGGYQDTPFSDFLREAGREWTASVRESRAARPFHVILDEMNLAKVEYYFAAFLSAMELRSRDSEVLIRLANDDSVTLGPNLRFVGTVNIDETTHLFSDKVFDRAQLVELTVDRDELAQHVGEAAWATTLLALWDILIDVAPFAFRVADEIGVYVAHAEDLGVSWQEALDEQIYQKLLPKLKGGDSRIGPALEQLMELTVDEFPLSHSKAKAMSESYAVHGFSSYF